MGNTGEHSKSIQQRQHEAGRAVPADSKRQGGLSQQTAWVRKGCP